MKKNIWYRRKSGELLRALISDIPDWEGFYKLLQFVQKRYNAEIISKADGPDARVCILSCKGKKFKLIFMDDYGNYFEPFSQNDEPIVLEICADLEKRLAEV
jgi:hypothetical protein